MQATQVEQEHPQGMQAIQAEQVQHQATQATQVEPEDIKEAMEQV